MGTEAETDDRIFGLFTSRGGFFLSTSVFFHDDVFVSLFIPSSDFSCYFFRFNVISIGFVFLDFI